MTYQDMQIGEIAAMHDVSVKALRLYEKLGILRPARVDPQTGYRYYTADQVARVGSIKELKLLGFSLKEIREIFARDSTYDDLRDALIEKKSALTGEVSRLENRIAALNRIVENVELNRPVSERYRMSEEARAELLAKLTCIEDLSGRAPLTEAIWL